ncbi:epoxide hydrolase family protein [Maliponia aquimaris]|uniref:Soluble epoxide hydrolase n=1 Tax=Maliponia aquimaris TaxID=1673631 RepID=A0A238JRF4_9RHOB|nr:epoxide hydrolase family protein [Maliponia aquimaris]SMX33043.1 Soluble epoxide hydrolase [Maliponia aquimaris]
MAPFSLHIPRAQIDDLHLRLSRTRFADRTPGPDWAYGTDPDWLADLVAYWRDGFDWRAQEAALNAFQQVTLPLHGIDLHAIRAAGKGPAPRPLLLLHGWPGSVFEFLDILPMLTDPARFGGDPEDAFTVIAPSLPGFGLSFAPGQRRFSAGDMADVLADLMTALGHDRFGVQGGDWGAFAGSALALRHPSRVTGLHLNYLPLRPQPSEFEREETAYAIIQGTKPQTLAFALTDSPAGLAAWIGEKFHRWTDHAGDPFTAVSRDRMLANISLYWFTGAIGSSFWPYYARLHGDWPVPDESQVRVPMGHAAFPREIRRPGRAAAERMFPDIRRWTEMAAGGHFAAMEQPAALAQEIRAFFRPLQGAATGAGPRSV